MDMWLMSYAPVPLRLENSGVANDPCQCIKRSDWIND
jgi:hypothetical protein